MEGREQRGRRNDEGCRGGGGGRVLAVIFVFASFACFLALPPNISQTSPKKIAYGTALWILSASVGGVPARLELLRGGIGKSFFEMFICEFSFGFLQFVFALNVSFRSEQIELRRLCPTLCTFSSSPENLSKSYSLIAS